MHDMHAWSILHVIRGAVRFSRPSTIHPLQKASTPANVATATLATPSSEKR